MRSLCLSWSASTLLLALMPAGTASAAVSRQGAQELKQLEQRLAEERKSWLEFKKQARTEAERAELVAAFPRDEFVEELTAIASEAKGTEVAARAWIDLFHIACMLDERALFAQALERLLTDHLASPEMAGLALDLVYGAPPWTAPAAADALRKILAGTSDKGLQAGVLAELALLVGLDDTFGAAGRAEAEALLQRVEKEFAGADDFIGMSGKQFAAGARHEINALRVGQVAPDFEIADQDGVRFKLSDYRGRVVLLDFWGFVWRTCMGLLPHKKALVERLKDQPFTFLGMFGREGDPAEIAARMKKENINWRNGLDLSSSERGEAEDGTRWSTWAVRGFPQFYLLDEQGVIRKRWFGNPGEDVMDREVDLLLAELAAKSARK